jgi:hypothetical protein
MVVHRITLAKLAFGPERFGMNVDMARIVYLYPALGTLEQEPCPMSARSISLSPSS